MKGNGQDKRQPEGLLEPSGDTPTEPQAVLSSLLENIADVIFQLSPRGIIQYITPKVKETYGYDAEELRGQHISKTTPAGDMPKAEEALRRALGGETVHNLEIHQIHRSGRLIPVEVNLTPLRQGGRVVALVGVMRDITQRKAVEEALRESEQFNSSLLNNSLHPILVIDPDTSVRYVNPALEKLTGFTSEELIGTKAPYPWLTEESLPKTRQEFELAMRRGTQWFEELFQKKNGELFWVEITSAPIMHNGELKYYMSSWVDITERKRMEDALRREKERAEGYLDIAAVMLATTDTQGNITMINRKGCAILGYQAGELVGKNWFDTLVPERVRDEVREFFSRLMAGDIEPVKHYESPLVTKDGEERLISFNSTVIREANGEIVGALVSGEDITELRKTQEQLQHARLLASLGEMTAGIAHEVNNPLGSILLYSELLMASDVPPQIRKDLRVIHDEAKRAAKIMTDLLTYGRRTKSQMRRVNLHTPLKKVLEMRRYEQKVQNVTVSTRLHEGPLYVKGDPSQLMQVFMNLILNAEEALRESRGGNIVITSEAAGEWARVSIADDGVGIPEEDLNMVFYPFYTTKQVGEGTGLGLSTCYGIVTAHNGLIRAENNDMGGATFTVELPLANGRRKGPLNREKGRMS